MSVYKSGTVQVSNGSTAVIGTGTAWFGALQDGWIFTAPDGRNYEIESIASDASLTLGSAYLGANASGQDYFCFPTRALDFALHDAIKALISDFQGMMDTYGVGLSPDGTVLLPSQAFSLDPDTGRFRLGSNHMADVAGGVKIADYEADGITAVLKAVSGAAVQSSLADTASGRLQKVGAFGWGLSGAATVSTDDLDAWTTNGLIRYTSSTTGAPSSAGVVLHIGRMSTEGAGTKMQLGFAHSGGVYTRVSNATGWDDWTTVARSGTTPNFNGVNVNGNQMGGEQITIADDAVGIITPPRNGGFVVVSCNGNGDFMQLVESGIFCYDCGASLNISEVYAGSKLLMSTADVTGTTGADGYDTVAVQSDVIKIENRSGQPRTYQVTFC